jgi:hypothetical protein
LLIAAHQIDWITTLTGPMSLFAPEPIRKGQFNVSVVGLKDTAAPAVWDAVLFNR